MAEITEATSIEELAVIISEALEAAGIAATLSGGGAVGRWGGGAVGRWGGIDLQPQPVHESRP